MNCKDLRPLLSQLVDGELDKGNKAKVESHLKDCRECEQWLKQLKSLNQIYTTEKAPAVLKAQVLSKVNAENRKSWLAVLGEFFQSKKPASIGSLAALFVTVIFSIFVLSSNKTEIFEAPQKSYGLPAVGSFSKLKSLLKKADSGRSKMLFKGGFGGVWGVPEAAGNPEVLSEGFPHSGYSSPMWGKTENEYSETNIQVKGVDEADVVKTDGKYIYQINKKRVVIAEVSQPQKMKIIKKLSSADINFNPTELYVDDNYLITIGNSFRKTKDQEFDQKSLKSVPEIYPSEVTQETVKVFIFDITDKSNIKQVREVELDGNYVSSRKIGSSLYFVANKYLDNYRIMEQKTENPSFSATPAYRDSAGADKGEYTNVGYSAIRYFPDAVEPNYILIAGLNLNEPSKELKVSTYLGSGNNVYVSSNNLFVAVTNYKETKKKVGTQEWKINLYNETQIYKFALRDGQTEYKGKGTSPGTIINQFSMDESDNYFRIATTKDEFAEGENSKNNIYVLNKDMQTVGKIEDIAPGERIYSTRFIGDRAYMVTFKQTDPLFVIDLKDPKSPKILGKLKIPGYSDYLHPYDENHIIGFGKDTTETKDTAYYQGMKLAIFDVTDVENPEEMFKTTIGDRGTDSELLRNHKALLFDKDKNLLAFPVTVMEIKHKKPVASSSLSLPESPGRLPIESGIVTDVSAYGEFVFQGAYVYNIDLIDGFKLKGKITHLSDDDYKKAGTYWFDNDKSVERIIYIDDTLYSLSKKMIKANNLLDLKEKNNLVIE